MWSCYWDWVNRSIQPRPRAQENALLVAEITLTHLVGAENILALRCIHSRRRLRDFWKHRLNAQTARNEALRLAA